MCIKMLASVSGCSRQGQHLAPASALLLRSAAVCSYLMLTSCLPSDPRASWSITIQWLEDAVNPVPKTPAHTVACLALALPSSAWVHEGF